LRDIVASKLVLDWSPEQIAGWLKAEYPNNESMRVASRQRFGRNAAFHAC
jgi:IS30 family transposase